MSDISQEELGVLEAFINIRNRLTALKKVSLAFCPASFCCFWTLATMKIVIVSRRH